MTRSEYVPDFVRYYRHSVETSRAERLTQLRSKCASFTDCALIKLPKNDSDGNKLLNDHVEKKLRFHYRHLFPVLAIRFFNEIGLA